MMESINNNTLTIANTSWTYCNCIQNPNLKVSKQNQNYILDLGSMQIRLSEKELVEWIIKFEMAIK